MYVKKFMFMTIFRGKFGIHIRIRIRVDHVTISADISEYLGTDPDRYLDLRG